MVAGYGIKACLMPGPDQIHAAYGHDEAITSNCHTRVAFAPNRIETARLLSQMTGETPSVTRTGQFQFGCQRFGAGSGEAADHAR